MAATMVIGGGAGASVGAVSLGTTLWRWLRNMSVGSSELPERDYLPELRPSSGCVLGLAGSIEVLVQRSSLPGC